MASIVGTDITVISLALNNMAGEIANNIFQQIPTLDYLRQTGNVKMLDGGERINFPVMHAANSTAASYSGYDVINTTPSEGIGNVEYTWKQYAVTIAISGRERRQVRGRFAIADILEAKRSQAEMSLADIMSQHVYTAQTGTNLTGLPDLVAASPTTGTVGGINRATNTWWRNQQTSGASSATAFDNLLDSMRAIYNLCWSASKKFGPPNLMTTTRTVYEGYEGLVDSQRMYANEKLLNLGFDNLAFKQAGLIFDNDGVSGRLYALNTKTLFLAVHTEANFTPTEFVKPSNQDAIASQILFMGDLVSLNASTNGVITSIT